MARSHLPPGFRFHPTDEELLVHYLKRKAAGKFVDDWVIGDIDIYKFEPAELPGLANLRSRDFEWFFFNPQDKRNLHGSRTNRTTKAGYWKATGKDRKVTVGSCVGLKKTLIYYAGRAPHGERTDWVMHEYRLDEESKKKMSSDTSFVLCRVRRKSGLGPRNGEQYGAPVFEEETEEVNNSINEAYVLPSPSTKYMGESKVQEILPVATVIDSARMGMEVREDFDSFLQNVISFEEPERDQILKGDLVMDELFGLLTDQSDLDFTHVATANNLEVDPSSMENFCSLVRPGDSESVMLQNMFHLVSDQLQPQPEPPSGLQEPSQSSHMDTLQSVGFLELADLEEPCHEQNALEPAALESLLLELDAGMEFPVGLMIPAQDELQVQQSLQPSGHNESVRGLARVGDSGVNNELEVRLDSSQGLSVLGSEQTRLLAADDAAVPSGLTLSPDHDGAFALSHSNEIRAQEQPASNTALSEAKLEGANSTAGPPNDSSNQPAHSPPSPSPPSSLARVISEFLGKVNALPASAEELPLELERHQLLDKEKSLCFAAESKALKSVLPPPSSLGISGSSLNFRVELTSSQNEKQLPRMSELELQWSVSSTVSLDQHIMRSCRSFTNGFSMFLFWITTLALVLFCMFRGLCRSTRVALV